MMDNWIKRLVLVYFILSIVKCLMTLFTLAPSEFNDGYIYVKMAWAFFNHGNILIYNKLAPLYPPLYSILLSISYFFKDMDMAYTFMKFLNAFVSTAIVFPIYLIAKDFLSKRKALVITVLVSLITPIFIFSNYIMAENLLFPLLIFSVYFLYNGFKKDCYKYFIWAGIFTGLCILTKMISLAILPAIFISYLILIKNSRFKKIIVYYISAFVTILPYLVWRLLFSPESPMGYKKETTVSKLVLNLTSNFFTFVNWHFNYVGYLILASGIIFVVYYLMGLFIKKEYNLKVFYVVITTISFFYIFLAANHSSTTSLLHNSPFIFYSYRPLGRYIAPLFPLIMLAGFIVFNKVRSKGLKLATLITSIILLISTQLTLSPLFPINNSSLTYLGIYQYIIEYLFYTKTSFDVIFNYGSFILMGVTLFLIPFILLFAIKKKYFVKIIFIFLIINLLLAISVHVWNVNTNWVDNNQVKMGQWIGGNIPDDNLIVLDISDCGFIEKKEIDESICSNDGIGSSPTAFWIDQQIVLSEGIGPGDYFLTVKEYDLNLIKSFGNIKLYEIKNE